MACSNCLNVQTLAGLARDCSNNIGGIKRALIGLHLEGRATISGGTVTAISTGETASPSKFYEYCPRKNSSSFTSTLNVNDNGSKFIANEIQLFFSRMQAASRAEVQALALADCDVIIEDNNGMVWYFGVDEPVSSTGGTGQTGAAKTDTNEYNVILGNEELEYPRPVADTVDIDALIA